MSEPEPLLPDVRRLHEKGGDDALYLVRPAATFRGLIEELRESLEELDSPGMPSVAQLDEAQKLHARASVFQSWFMQALGTEVSLILAGAPVGLLTKAVTGDAVRAWELAAGVSGGGGLVAAGAMVLSGVAQGKAERKAGMNTALLERDIAADLDSAEKTYRGLFPQAKQTVCEVLGWNPDLWWTDNMVHSLLENMGQNMWAVDVLIGAGKDYVPGEGDPSADEIRQDLSTLPNYPSAYKKLDELEL